jgi:hypothetical protein
MRREAEVWRQKIVSRPFRTPARQRLGDLGEAPAFGLHHEPAVHLLGHAAF